MKHNRAIVRSLSRQTGLSAEDVRAGLDELTKARFLKHASPGYIATFPEDEPPADRAGGASFGEGVWVSFPSPPSAIQPVKGATKK